MRVTNENQGMLGLSRSDIPLSVALKTEAAGCVPRIFSLPLQIGVAVPKTHGMDSTKKNTKSIDIL
jgi:hypothetical protein